MKLATLRDDTPDGMLIVVNRDLDSFVRAAAIASTMRDALDRWAIVQPQLRTLSEALDSGTCPAAEPLDVAQLLAPLPRAFGWVDGTAYLSHMRRARELRGATLPDDFAREPLMTERISTFLAPTAPLPLPDPSVDMDVEGEVGVILGDVPAGASLAEARDAIRLVTLVNDVSLRRILAETVLRGRSATLMAKPYPTMAPVAVTPDELGDAWDGELLNLRMDVAINGRPLASPDGSMDASFSFPQLIAYSATYRPLPCGTVLAAGTLSNDDDDVGGACIAEMRCIEQKRTGAPATPYLAPGDRITIGMRDRAGASVFGTIEQEVVGTLSRP